MSQAVETVDVNGRRVLDVSGLPNESHDHHEPVWWGNALLMFIESMSVILLLVSYFYIRRNFDNWPPPQPHTVPPLFYTAPDLPIPTVELILVALSCLPMYWTDMAARREDERGVKRGLFFMLLVSIAMVTMRFFEMQGTHLKFRWDENAYGSIIWVILGTHLTYLLAGMGEFFIMLLWIKRRGLDPKHGLDVTLAGGYWYWVAITWAFCYTTVYWGARWL